MRQLCKGVCVCVCECIQNMLYRRGSGLNVAPSPCDLSLLHCWTVRTSKVSVRCSLMGVQASVSAVMNCKHLHNSRKPARWKRTGGARKRPALKLKRAHLLQGTKLQKAANLPARRQDACKHSHVIGNVYLANVQQTSGGI